ncbi:MAG: cysteine desulfurase [Clostridiales bacterium]|nr:cysteine desulfurase [Clostridiales bacterium]
MIYFDNSATTKPLAEVAELVAQDLKSDELWGNPGSLHELGTAAYKAYINAKEDIASCLFVREQELVFTSCATESANTAITGFLRRNKRNGRTIISTKTEHRATLSVLERFANEGYTVKYINVDKTGKPDLNELSEAIDADTTLMCFTHVNNETGAILPLNEIVEIRDQKNRNTALYVDFVQAAGKIKLNLKELKVDLASFSAHKFHGLKGSGFLYVKNGIKIDPYILGGGQQNGVRSGTESVYLYRATALALKKSQEDIEEHYSEVKKINEYLREELSKRKATILSPEDALPYVLNVSFDGFESETMLHCLERYNIYVSTISACSSKTKKISYVLEAMGVDRKLATNAVRLSFSRFNTMEEAKIFIEKIDEIYELFALR